MSYHRLHCDQLSLYMLSRSLFSNEKAPSVGERAGVRASVRVRVRGDSECEVERVRG